MIIQNSNPTLAAREIHVQIGWTNPKDFTLEEIANALGIIIKYEEIKGSEGRILIKGNTGIITLNSTISHQGKKNFVVAHEVGHFILHKNITPLFSDTVKTLSEWHKKGKQEQQANEFASELLMPEDLYRNKVKDRKLSIQLIEEVSSYFNVSLIAAFLKYVTLGKFPVMIIFMESGIVKWKQCSIDFPFPFLPYNSVVPALTVAGDYFNKKMLENMPERVDAMEWFPDDFKLIDRPKWQLWEQCYKISEAGLISCLWT